MSKIVIFSAANPRAAENLEHSVLAGVPRSAVAGSTILPQLAAHYGSEPVRTWGSPTGDRGRKRSVWMKIDPPAAAFFYSGGQFTVSARIWGKEPPSREGETGNPALADAIWGDPSFEHIVYLDQVERISLSSAEMKAALGYETGYFIGREFMTPNEEIEQQVLDAFGSAEAFREALIGRAGVPTRIGPAPPLTLGSAYRREDGSRRPEHGRLYEADPDLIDRGTRVHAEVQNALADHLAHRGLTPRSWSMAEPFYDLAWEQNGEIWLAEIKSLTSENEERQLRLALGQVLRYAHQLAYKGRPIRKVLALEHEPTDPSWTALCNSLDIAIVWPPDFQFLLT